RLLTSWTQAGTDLAGMRRWLFDGLSETLDREYYAASASTGRRENLKALCMGADSGVHWARTYLGRGFPDALTSQLMMFTYLEEQLIEGRIRSVHQVACCSGREIGYYAKRYPEIDFCGSDVEPQIVEFLREHWRKVPNLRFEVLPLESTSPQHRARLEADLVFASGGLHYMDEYSLKSFFTLCREACKTLLLSQPLHASFDPAYEKRSTPRIQLSWNHPYTRYLTETGWIPSRQAEMQPPGQARFKNLAVEAHTPPGA
ncbi:MAG: class I SAM-dependent methyltransferase, partial [Myxococcota bacterium]|nr:class I SAM-dependent methyltransferase [Myxococcota bacterium]